jgi:hypothetical protein
MGFLLGIQACGKEKAAHWEDRFKMGDFGRCARASERIGADFGAANCLKYLRWQDLLARHTRQILLRPSNSFP